MCHRLACSITLLIKVPDGYSMLANVILTPTDLMHVLGKGEEGGGTW